MVKMGGERQASNRATAMENRATTSQKCLGQEPTIYILCTRFSLNGNLAAELRLLLKNTRKHHQISGSPREIARRQFSSSLSTLKNAQVSSFNRIKAVRVSLTMEQRSPSELLPAAGSISPAFSKNVDNGSGGLSSYIQYTMEYLQVTQAPEACCLCISKGCCWRVLLCTSCVHNERRFPAPSMAAHI